MKLNDIWRAIMFNWPIKVFSLVLAIGLYLVVNYTTMDQRRVEIPLQVVLPSGFEATSTVPDAITLIIKSDSRYIAMIDPWVITATADFSSVDSEGVASVPVLLGADPSYMAIEVSFSTDPEVIRIYFAHTEATEDGGTP